MGLSCLSTALNVVSSRSLKYMCLSTNQYNLSARLERTRLKIKITLLRSTGD